MDDAAAAGDAAYNLAACYLVLGDGEKAAAYIGEAKAELQRSGRSPAEALLLEAEAAALGGRGSDAAELCRGILSLDDASEEPRHRAQALLLLARIARDGKDLSGARRLLSEAEEPLDDADDLSLFARAAGLEAAILLLEESPAAAAEALDREAALLRDAGRYREMAAALARAGDAYLEAGDPAAAAERLYRSARSLLGQGHEAAARQRAGTALTAARAAGDEDLEKRILLLLQD
jgi:tetratricopeptide (TPR) repeat protein